MPSTHAGLARRPGNPHVKDDALLEAVLLYTVQLTAIFSAILLAVGYLKANPHQPSGRVFAVGLSFVVLYIFEGMGGAHVDPLFRVDISPWPWRLLVHPAVQAVPGLFMIYSFLVFQEGRHFPRPLLALFALQVFFEAFILLPEGGFELQFPAQFRTGLDISQLAFVGLALFWTLKGWSDDLVQDRRLLRWVAISVQGLMLCFVLVVENVLVANTVIDLTQARLLTTTAIALMLTGIVIVLVRLDQLALGRMLQGVPLSADQNENSEPPELNLDTFDDLFRKPRLFRETGLTISGLASQLNLPEYRLRQFINLTMGYRNFNAMLHKYRIEDACELLADPKLRNVPIQKVALTVGYQSATTFNNAFRENTGETPSDYRKRMFGDQSRSL
ncbi:MAG: helix-turn-helix domain-containing protein [Gammaproteobacteria bacterium]|jgi:AraC-like DNA-binding protein